jgi:hypothetical protein
MDDGTITIQRGDSASVGITLSNPDSSPYNATGSTLTFTVRKTALSTPILTKTVTSFINGGSQAAISLSTTDTTIDVRAWKYGLALVDGSGNRKTSGYHPFYITENESPSSNVSVVIGSDAIEVAVTVTPVGAIEGLPHGGTAGQVLAKLSDADLDTGWADDQRTRHSASHSLPRPA